MACTRINKTAESQGALVTIGDLMPTDFNNATTPGIYYLGGTTRTNGPTTYQWRFLVVISVWGTHQQFVFGNMNEIYFRGFSGSPGAWGAWHKVTSTT